MRCSKDHKQKLVKLAIAITYALKVIIVPRTDVTAENMLVIIYFIVQQQGAKSEDIPKLFLLNLLCLCLYKPVLKISPGFSLY